MPLHYHSSQAEDLLNTGDVMLFSGVEAFSRIIIKVLTTAFETFLCYKEIIVRRADPISALTLFAVHLVRLVSCGSDRKRPACEHTTGLQARP